MLRKLNNLDIRVYLIAIGIVVGIICGLFAYWTWYPYKTIEFKSLYQTEKTVYYQGDKTFYVVNYCKYTDARASITKEFVDGLVFSVDSPQAILNRGCREQEVPMTIPETLPIGEYRLRNTVTYFVSPTQAISKTNYSNWFEVKASRDTDKD